MTTLTADHNGRRVSAINGTNPLWGRQNPLNKTASRHVSYGYFCARIPGAILRLWREGGEYKTLRGNKPACLLTGSYPPATSAVVRSQTGGLFNSHQEGFDMTDHDNAGNLPATYPVPKTITDIEAAFAALAQAGDQDFDSHLIEWREAQLRNLCALDMRELSIKMDCLSDITGECGGLTPKGQELVHGWVQSIQRDIHKMMEG